MLVRRGIWNVWLNYGCTEHCWTLTEKQLFTKGFNIVKKKLVSQVEIDQLHITTWTKEDPEEQVDVQPKIEAEAKLTTPPPLQNTATDMRQRIMDKLATVDPRDHFSLLLSGYIGLNPFSHLMSMDISSRVELLSATSYTWMISSCMPRMNRRFFNP